MEKKKEKYDDWVGRKIHLWLASSRRPIICIVTEVNEEKRGIKFRAYRRRPALANLGFIQEGDQWIIQEWAVCRN